MAIDLALYGRPRFYYRGRGTLISSDDVEYSGSFVAAQYASGRVFLAIEINEPSPVPVFLDGERFEGIDDSGQRVKATGLNQTNQLRDPEGSHPDELWHVYRVNTLVVQAPNVEEQVAQEAKVGLVNLEFRGTPTMRNSRSGTEMLQVDTQFHGEDVSFALRSVPHARHVVKRIKTLRGIDLTAELEVQQACLSRLAEPEAFLTAVTYLLSIARGTKVQWVYRKDVDGSGVVFSIEHYGRVTKPFAPLAPLDPRDHHNTSEFLRSTLPHFKRVNRQFLLDRGTIDAYLDARSEQDFLETRAAKLAVALEALKAVFVDSLPNPDDEYHLPRKRFDQLVVAISSAIKETLAENQVNKNIQNALASQGKIKGLNRKSFRSLVKRLGKMIGLKLSEDEIQLFVYGRNSLVHTGRFYCKTATAEQRTRVEPLASAWDEYVFMIHFLDRLLLALVEYKGEYLDRRIPSRPTRISLTDALV